MSKKSIQILIIFILAGLSSFGIFQKDTVYAQIGEIGGNSTCQSDNANNLCCPAQPSNCGYTGCGYHQVCVGSYCFSEPTCDTTCPAGYTCTQSSVTGQYGAPNGAANWYADTSGTWCRTSCTSLTATPIPTDTVTPTTPTPPPPTVSGTPPASTITPTPNLLSDFLIPIGTKDTLSINIGGGGGSLGGPQVRFGIKLFGVEKTPDIKVRLKADDLVAELTPTPSPGATDDTCQAPGPNQFYYKDLVMTADGSGVYHPKEGTSYTALVFGQSAKTGTVLSGGWVELGSLSPGKSYSLSVKGEKHRSQLMVTNFVISSGSAIAAQDFDWTSKPLDPGDLPDPANGMKQDCTVNAADVSLLKSRMGKTTGNDLTVADLDYNNIVNAADMSELVHTLSTKPDDN